MNKGNGHLKTNKTLNDILTSAIMHIAPNVISAPKQTILRTPFAIHVSNQYTLIKEDFVPEIEDVGKALSINMKITSALLLSSLGCSTHPNKLAAIGVPQQQAIIHEDNTEYDTTTAYHIYVEQPQNHAFMILDINNGALFKSPLPIPPFTKMANVLKKGAIVDEFKKQHRLSNQDLVNRWISHLSTTDPLFKELDDLIKNVS